jgi:hypothetical protein
MKKIISGGLLLLMLVSSSILTSCSDDNDPEVYAPKIYLYSPLKAGVTARSEIVQSPISIVMPDDEQEFKVYLSKEVDHDVVVTVVENPELSAAYNEEDTALPVGSVEFLSNDVVIPAGQTVSTASVRVKLKQNSDMEALEGDGIIALQITTKSNVAAEENRQAFYWTVSKQHRNIFVGSEEGLTDIGKNDFTLSSNTNSKLLRRLTDGKSNASWNAEVEDYVQAQFKAPTLLKGVAVFPYFAHGVDLQGCPKALELQISDNGEEWSSLGTITFDLPAVYEPMLMQLYSPVETSYVRIVLKESFSKDADGNNTIIRLAECKFYK